MTPDRFDDVPHGTWYVRGARRRGAALATAAAVVLFGFVGVTPAYAEEVVSTSEATDAAVTTEAEPTPEATTEPAPEATTEPAPTDAPVTDPEPTDPPPATDPEPTDPPTEPTDPPPTTDPEPTDPPTEPTDPPPTTDPEPTDPPTEPTDPPPTTDPEPTDPPTEPTDPPPTTDPEPTSPAPTPPAPTTGAPSAPVVSPSSRPFVGFTTTSTRAVASAQTAALVAARAKIDRAVAALREAEAALADARSMREVAQAAAERMQRVADEAHLEADAAGRVYFAAAQGDGTTISSMDAVFGAGNDLLAGLGGVARVTQIAGDAEKLLQIADRLAEKAAAAQQRADEAWAAVGAVPVEQLEEEVASAERAVTTARTELAELQARGANESRLASSNVELIMSLPTDAGQLSDQGWAQPVAGRLTSGFGPRPNKPLPGVNDFHRGTDIAAACNTPVFAATGGVVATAGPNGGLGNWVLIDHGSGVDTGYGHLISGGVFVSPGETVAAGQLIGAVGSTGASTGCHLHFEVRIGGVAVDAVPFLAARGVSLG